MPSSSSTPGLWPTLALLFVAVLAPTVCILWFMNRAMHNARVAVRQRLTDAYGAQLRTVQVEVEKKWADRLAAIGAIAADQPPGKRFEAIVGAGLCDSVIIFDHVGHIAYPSPATRPADDPAPPAPWIEARRLEHIQGDPAAAAEIYGRLARETSDADWAARALLGEARCLARGGRKDDALAVLTGQLTSERYRDAKDETGRLVQPNGLLFALELVGLPAGTSSRGPQELTQSEGPHPHPGPLPERERGPETRAGCERMVTELARRLGDYEDLSLPSGQRRFLMARLSCLVRGLGKFPTLEAEELAAALAESDEGPGRDGTLVSTPLPNIWQTRITGQPVVALFRKERIDAETEPILGRLAQAGASVALLPPADRQGEPFLAIPAGQAMPGWRLAVQLDGPDPFAAAAQSEMTLYAWTAIAVIVVIIVAVLLIVRQLSRQARLTRLKNDLTATVSHELKTPLTSMRVLVDTLLEGNYQDPKQATEYLGLVARENARLSRLIDNFLTFSRMERNKQTFEFAPVRPEEIVQAAVDSVRERFTSPSCQFEVDIAAGLPPIVADHDAMITVLINLLDNAWKYTGEQKHIVLRVSAVEHRPAMKSEIRSTKSEMQNQTWWADPRPMPNPQPATNNKQPATNNRHVCFEVQDNGLGIPRRAIKRIFERFYQVDQTLSRHAGGCGLGLSIVKFIVEAHGGTIGVKSELGSGSTFAVALPVVPVPVNKHESRNPKHETNPK